MDRRGGLQAGARHARLCACRRKQHSVAAGMSRNCAQHCLCAPTRMGSPPIASHLLWKVFYGPAGLPRLVHRDVSLQHHRRHLRRAADAATVTSSALPRRVERHARQAPQQAQRRRAPAAPGVPPRCPACPCACSICGVGAAAQQERLAAAQQLPETPEEASQGVVLKIQATLTEPQCTHGPPHTYTLGLQQLPAPTHLSKGSSSSINHLSVSSFSLK